MSLPLDFKTLIIPAGNPGNPGVARSQLAGVFFYCKSSAAPFQMQFDAGTIFPFDTGFKIRNPETAKGSFQTITFYNTTGNAILINFYVGSAEVDFVGGGAVKEVSSRAAGGGIQTLEPAAVVTIQGTLAGSQRKQIIITNLDPVAPLLVLDLDNAVFAAVFAQAPWTVPTDAAVKLKNDTAAAINYCVGEIYYNA